MKKIKNMPISIMLHAYKRGRERFSWHKDKVEKFACKAWDEGTTSKNYGAHIKWYLDQLSIRYKCYPRIYQEIVFVFRKNILVTVFPVPKRFIRYLQ